MSSTRYWESTSDDEYLDHLKKMEKAPTMHPDLPLYPNVHSVFKNKLGYEEKMSSLNSQNTESQKKVQFAESNTNDIEKESNKNDIEEESNKNDIEKPERFKLHKWRTFKEQC